MTLSIPSIEKILNAKRFGDNDGTIDNVSIDSRSMQNNEKTLFFALVGPNNDAHIYISSQIEKGVRNFVVTYIPKECEGKANFFIVENTLDALQQFAAYHRSIFKFPVIGLTGSNGKTIVKEWLNFLLSPDFNIIRSPKSYNSQVGVPLSVISINDRHNLGIFEAGISKMNEMEKLEAIIKPSIGIITSIGTAHDEGFDDLEKKIKEKLKLFKHSKLIIYQKNKVVDLILSSIPRLAYSPFGGGGDGVRGLFSWSYDDETADVFVSKKSVEDKTMLQIRHAKSNFEIEIPFQDVASVENAITCLMVLLSFKYDKTTIQNRMRLLYPVEMRLKVKNGINNTTLIDDSYSSDFQSLKIALDFLESQKQYKNKTVILSDIFQSGLSNEELYTKVSQLIVSNKINRVIGIGETISAFKNKFTNCITFKNTADFFLNFNHLNFNNETILIKGARHFQFEKIVKLLQEKTHETVLEINTNALIHNLN